mgnify:FL=1
MYTSLIDSVKASVCGNTASTSNVESSTMVTVGVSVMAGRPAEPSSLVAGVPSNPKITSFMLSLIVSISRRRI